MRRQRACEERKLEEEMRGDRGEAFRRQAEDVGDRLKIAGV